MEYKSPAELFAELKKLCEDQFKKKNSHAVTVGAEIEFFLLDENHQLVDLDKSQLFLGRVHKALGLRDKLARTGLEILDDKECISYIKFPVTKDSWVSICYEYPPHLLEVSFSYHKSLLSLKSEMDYVFDLLYEVANSLRFVIHMVPLLSEDHQKNMHTIDNKLQGKLRESRIKLLNEGPYKGESHLADFPSYLAATHIHIGGHPWWDDNRFMNNLYRLEPFLMHEAEGISLKKRWDFYHKVFHNFPLVGFPEVWDWKADWWVDHLFHTSYQNQKASIQDIFGLNKLRDLQIIRPRIIGTVEFRADPAQNTVDKIINLAALRLGQYLMAKEDLPAWVPNYAQARDMWINSSHAEGDSQHESHHLIFEKIGLLLEARGFGEEKLLMKQAIKKTA